MASKRGRRARRGRTERSRTRCHSGSRAYLFFSAAWRPPTKNVALGLQGCLLGRGRLTFMRQINWPGYRSLKAGRYSQQNGVYFVTTTTDQRIPWFQVMSFACVMCRNLEHPSCLADAKNLCWVVMPDHVHLLLQVGARPLQNVINQMKSRTARILNREIGRSGQFWSPGFYDHALRKDEDMLNIARYIVANPLRARLVNRVGDYPYWNAVWL